MTKEAGRRIKIFGVSCICGIAPLFVATAFTGGFIPVLPLVIVAWALCTGIFYPSLLMVLN